MNGRRFLLTCFTVWIASLLCSGVSAATLPPNVRTTTNSQSVRPQVVSFVEREAKKLESDAPATLAEGRDNLIAEVVAGGNPTVTPSSAFLDVYADALNAQLVKLANHANSRVRVNAAITAAKVAEKAKNARLAPTIIDLLDDPNEGVVLWALKGSREVIGPSHAGTAPQSAKLMPAFVAAAKKHAASGPMIQAAYESLKAVDATASSPGAIKSAVDATHEVLKARREVYIKRLPEFASNENAAITFLTARRVWMAQTPAQQLQTVQAISDLAGLVAQRYGSVGSTERGELATMLSRMGGALQVIGQNSEMSIKMDPIGKHLKDINAATSVDDIAKRATATYSGLTTLPAFKDLKPAPTIEK